MASIRLYKQTQDEHRCMSIRLSMARQLPVAGQVNMSQAGLVAGTLALCALALFMCASHSHKWHRRWKACYGYSKEDPVIQLDPQPQGVIQEYQQVENGDRSTCSGDVSLWQKNILMGGKCQLPDFSGVIIYDSAGNIINPAQKPLALPWK